jgi:hypothetical protein
MPTQAHKTFAADLAYSGVCVATLYQRGRDQRKLFTGRNCRRPAQPEYADASAVLPLLPVKARAVDWHAGVIEFVARFIGFPRGRGVNQEDVEGDRSCNSTRQQQRLRRKVRRRRAVKGRVPGANLSGRSSVRYFSWPVSSFVISSRGSFSRRSCPPSKRSWRSVTASRDFCFSQLRRLSGQALLSSGLLASRATHRLTIVASSAGVGGAHAGDRRWQITFGRFAVGCWASAFAAGLYMPSAIATITSLVDRRHWGKAIAVHELAPNLAFFASPFIAELFLNGRAGARLGRHRRAVASRERQLQAIRQRRRFSRRVSHVERLRRADSLACAVAHGRALQPRRQLHRRRLRHAAALSCHRTPSSIPSWANTIVAFSRAHGPILGLLGGWASDKLGAKQTIVISLGFTGSSRLIAGSVQGAGG